jgi:hypothetical protein
MITIKTASWFATVPSDHLRIGISRGTRGVRSGYRLFRELQPGSWYKSVSMEEYIRRYHGEVLAPLDPRVVADNLRELAADRVPVLCCYEPMVRERGAIVHWQHRGWPKRSAGLCRNLASRICRRNDIRSCPGKSYIHDFSPGASAVVLPPRATATRWFAWTVTSPPLVAQTRRNRPSSVSTPSFTPGGGSS